MKIQKLTKGKFALTWCLCAFASLCLFLPPAFGAINQSINYQGFLVSKATNMAVDSAQAMKFVLHTTPTGDTAQFTETRCTVGVSKGRYDVEIGSATAGGIPSAVFQNSPNLWLEIQVSPSGACGGPYEAMQPRIKLAAAPYSFNSVYASTASAATTVFSADTISALDVTTNGGLTISTNLYVMGGISVGSISPGQKLSVAGKVESKGLGIGGFVFPDGSEQITAVANTIWQLFGNDAGSVNTGNIGISTGAPQARLHVSTGTCPGCTVLLVSAGGSPLLSVDGQGFVTASNYFGDGSTLTGLVRKAGDSMGPLTLTAGSSMTVTAASGISAPVLKLFDNVEISSSSSLFYSGVLISTHVSLAPGARYYGDGSQITGVVSSDPTRVLKGGDTMTGLLTLPSLAVTTGAFTAGGSAFSVQAGSAAVNTAAYLARLTVGGGIVATSSITAQGNLYAPVLVATSANIFQGVTASSGVFTAVGQWSLVTSSTVRVNGGDIWLNPGGYYYGNGSQLTGVTGTDSTKVAKTGDTMSGNLKMSASSITIVYASAAEPYALTVSSAANPANYWLAVTTAGNVGVQLSNPTAPLSVYSRLLVGNRGSDAPASLHINSYNDSSFVRWSEGTGTDQGALGFLFGGNRDFVYRAGGSDLSTGGAEVFRIRTSADANNWKFGIGTTAPAEKFHVATNLLVGLNAASPILYISTTTGQVGISTDTTTHALRVNGGILAVSSITAQGGFFGDGAGITGINAGALPLNLTASNIAAATAAGVVFSSRVVMTGGVTPFTPDVTQNLQVDKSIRIGGENNGTLEAYLSLRPNSGPTYIKWSENTYDPTLAKGVLGFTTAGKDLMYKVNALDIDTGGTEVFKITGLTGAMRFGIGTQRAGIATPLAGFHVATDLLVSTAIVSPILFISTATGKVGIGTDVAQARLHVVSNSTTDTYVFAASHTVTGGLVVSTSGRIGIGLTTGLSARLMVKQSAADAYALKVSSNDGTAMMVVDKAGQVGIGINPPKAALSVASGTILAEGGWTGVLSVPVTGPGVRFMWLPSVAAIRAGAVDGTQWDTVGSYSTAFGDKTQAEGDYSIAVGQNNSSSGKFSMAVGGNSNEAGAWRSAAVGGDMNKVYGLNSFISGGGDNVVHSSYSWAGGYNNYLASSSSGTFVWGNNDLEVPGTNGLQITEDYVFLIGPFGAQQYKVGIGTASPQAVLDVNGSAQFGAGATKSAFTAEGFWQPRWMTSAAIQAAAPGVIGVVVGNSSIKDLCISTGTAAGNWALVGSKGLTGCY